MKNKSIKFLKSLIISSLFISSISPTHAAILTGEILLQNCKTQLQIADQDPAKSNPADTMKAGLCLGYFKGFDDMQFLYAIAMAERFEEVDKYSFYCLPGEVDTDKIIKIVVQYLEKNKDSLSKPAALLTLKALREAYPCKVEKNNNTENTPEKKS